MILPIGRILQLLRLSLSMTRVLESFIDYIEMSICTMASTASFIFASLMIDEVALLSFLDSYSLLDLCPLITFL